MSALSRRARCSLLSMLSALISLGVLPLVGCTTKPEPAKMPLAQAVAQEQGATAQPQQAADPLPASARAALDQGNTEFRAGRYDAALSQYRAAAQAAPDNAAPFFGIYMVAKKTGNRALADSASREISRRSSSNAMLSDSALRSLHASAAGSKR